MTLERREMLLKLGYFPVTKEFWLACRYPFREERDYLRFTWARLMPDGRYMPWSSERLEGYTDDELYHATMHSEPYAQAMNIASVYRELKNLAKEMAQDERVPKRHRAKIIDIFSRTTSIR